MCRSPHLRSAIQEIRDSDPIENAVRALQQFGEPAIFLGLYADTLTTQCVSRSVSASFLTAKSLGCNSVFAASQCAHISKPLERKGEIVGAKHCRPIHDPHSTDYNKCHDQLRKLTLGELRALAVQE